METIVKKIETIMKSGYVCDHCLGRQFAQLLTGTTNVERGKSIRMFAAILYDADEIDVDPSNFYGIKLRNKKSGDKKKCIVCEGAFDNMGKVAKKIAKKLGKIEFDTFLMGTRPTRKILENEERLWDKIGIEHCEPIKAEFNRELGKVLENIMEKKADIKTPHVSILYDMKNGISIQIKSIYIYGEYQKLKRGIPQTKWPSGKYKVSIEQIVAKPIMKVARGSGHKFHGYGREDIDALCTGWRPFVIEILSPKKRSFNLKEIQREINRDKRVKVRSLRWSSSEEVVRIKQGRGKKEYKCVVVCKRPIEKNELKQLKELERIIAQRTPTRVLHRRSNLLRKRRVFKISAKPLSSKKFEFKVLAESGTYIKELVSGDMGRTRPSISSILNNECTCKNLIVTKIEKKL